MSGLTKVSEGLEDILSILRRATEAVFQAALLVGCVCVIGLIVAGTYGLLHHGDDFGVDMGGNGNGFERGGGGDVIVMWGSL